MAITFPPAPRLQFGQAARIALCNHIEEVGEAKALDAHIAIWRDPTTVEWYKLLRQCRSSNDVILLGQLMARAMNHNDDCIDLNYTDMRQSTTAGFEYLHTDYLEHPEKFNAAFAFTTAPFLSLCWQLPVKSDDPEDEDFYMETAEGLQNTAMYCAPNIPFQAYIPAPASVVFFFHHNSDETSGHWVEPYSTPRARILGECKTSDLTLSAPSFQLRA